MATDRLIGLTFTVKILSVVMRVLDTEAEESLKVFVVINLLSLHRHIFASILQFFANLR
jgi:hypothetical protein